MNEHVRSSIGSNDSGSSSQSTSEARSSGTANSLTREPSLPAGVETVHLLAIADAHVPMVDEARAFVEHRRPPDAGKNGRVRTRRYAGEQPVASAAIRLVKGDWPAGLAEGQLFPSPCQPAGHAGSVRSYQASATYSNKSGRSFNVAKPEQQLNDSRNSVGLTVDHSVGVSADMARIPDAVG